MNDTDATRWLLGGLVALAAILLVGPFLLGPGSGMWGSMAGGMWGPMHDGSMGGVDSTWWLLVSVWRLLLLVALVGAVYLLYMRTTGEEPDPALEELRSAYARGDLSEEEFQRRRERLNE